MVSVYRFRSPVLGCLFLALPASAGNLPPAISTNPFPVGNIPTPITTNPFSSVSSSESVPNADAGNFLTPIRSNPVSLESLQSSLPLEEMYRALGNVGIARRHILANRLTPPPSPLRARQLEALEDDISRRLQRAAPDPSGDRVAITKVEYFYVEHLLVALSESLARQTRMGLGLELSLKESLEEWRAPRPRIRDRRSAETPSRGGAVVLESGVRKSVAAEWGLYAKRPRTVRRPPCRETQKMLLSRLEDVLAPSASSETLLGNIETVHQSVKELRTEVTGWIATHGDSETFEESYTDDFQSSVGGRFDSLEVSFDRVTLWSRSVNMLRDWAYYEKTMRERGPLPECDQLWKLFDHYLSSVRCLQIQTTGDRTALRKTLQWLEQLGDFTAQTRTSLEVPLAAILPQLHLLPVMPNELSPVCPNTSGALLARNQ